MRCTLMMGIGGHEDYVAVARAAEDAGWATISVPDSFFFPRTTESEYPYSDHEMIRGFLEVSPFIEPIVAMSVMAAATQTIRFCCGVMKVPMRQPIILAKQLTSLAVMSGERLDFGAGISPWKEDFTYNGVPFEKRGERFDEVIGIIRDAQQGEFFEHHSANYDFGPIRLTETPPAGVFGLAQRYRLSAYDASYLWLAAELRAPLLTFDGKLAAAAADCLAKLPPEGAEPTP